MQSDTEKSHLIEVSQKLEENISEQSAELEKQEITVSELEMKILN